MANWHIQRNVDCNDDVWRTVICNGEPNPGAQVMEGECGTILFGWTADDDFAPTPAVAEMLVALLNQQAGQ
jgi:hypothetical protein